MKNKKTENKYWENEEGELIEFGSCFMRCYDKAGKLQFGNKYFDTKLGKVAYVVRFTIDRKELLESDEGVSYLRGTLSDWEEMFEGAENED